MSIKLQTAQAILALNLKGVDTPAKAITEKKIGSFPTYSDGIQTAVREGYLKVVENSQPPKYYLSEHGLQFVHDALELLDIPE